MRHSFALFVALTASVGTAWHVTVPAAIKPAPASVILITLDGARTEEIFGGLDVDVFTSTLREKQVLREQPAYRRFWAETAQARREKLMPFFWGTLMREHGSIAGNRTIGSSVTLTNT